MNEAEKAEMRRLDDVRVEYRRRAEVAEKALSEIAARGGDTPPYSQMALDMWRIARTALAARNGR